MYKSCRLLLTICIVMSKQKMVEVLDALVNTIPVTAHFKTDSGHTSSFDKRCCQHCRGGRQRWVAEREGRHHTRRDKGRAH